MDAFRVPLEEAFGFSADARDDRLGSSPSRLDTLGDGRELFLEPLRFGFSDGLDCGETEVGSPSTFPEEILRELSGVTDGVFLAPPLFFGEKVVAMEGEGLFERPGITDGETLLDGIASDTSGDGCNGSPKGGCGASDGTEKTVIGGVGDTNFGGVEEGFLTVAEGR